jgi:hypothetical protein
MGWITNRHMQQGGGLNRNPKNNGSDKGPLRKRVEFVRERGHGFNAQELWKLECGHEAWGTYGAARTRCGKCKADLAARR